MFLSHSVSESLAQEIIVSKNPVSIESMKKFEMNLSESMGFSENEHNPQQVSNTYEITLSDSIQITSDQTSDDFIIVKPISDTRHQAILDRITNRNSRLEIPNDLYQKLYNVVIDGRYNNQISSKFTEFPLWISDLDVFSNILSLTDQLNADGSLLYADTTKTTNAILDEKNPAFLVFVLLPISCYILIRSEDQRISINARAFTRYSFVFLLLSSTVITPMTISSAYWHTTFAESDATQISNSTESFSNSTIIDTNSTIIDTNSTQIIAPTNSTNAQDSLSFSDELVLATNSTIIDISSTVIPESIITIPENQTIQLQGDEFVTISENKTDTLSGFTATTWVKPDYSKGSSEFTILSKENSFKVTIENKKTHHATFSVFDGISWTDVTSNTEISESWTHIGTVFENNTISIYVNGTLESTESLNGTPTLSENGKLTTTTVDNISSSEDVVIGAYVTTKKGSFKSQDKFSGEIDGVSLYDSSLDSLQINSEYESGISSHQEIVEDLDAALAEMIAESNPVITDTNSTQSISTIINSTEINTNSTQTITEPIDTNSTILTSIQEPQANAIIAFVHNTIELDKPVIWTQNVTFSNSSKSIAVELPDDAIISEITTKHDGKEKTLLQERQDKSEDIVTNNDIQEKKLENLKIIASDSVSDKITNSTIQTESELVPFASLDKIPEMIHEDKPKKVLLINDTADEVSLKFETPAPYKLESDLSTKGMYEKKVTITHNSTLHYTDVKSHSDIPESLVSKGVEFKLFWMVDDVKTDVTHDPAFHVEFVDTDGNGIDDQMQWIVSRLSTQEFVIEGIIIVTKAEHLDGNRQYVSDIYDSVKDLDGVWSETISDSHYVRVTFEMNLSSQNDITLYPKVISGAPRVAIYEKDGVEKIAEFTELNSNQYNKVLLTALSGTQNTFDLLILGGDVQFDHIVDPMPAPTFVAAGAVAANAAAITPALPAGIAADDILILFVETGNEAISIAAAGSAGTWTEVTGSPQGTGTTGTTGDGTRLTVFWARYTGSGTTGPTTTDSGDHQVGRIIAIRGAATSGNPINITGFGVNDVAGTTATIPGNTTTVPNTYVITATAVSLPDTTATNRFSGWTNADLSSITELIDNESNAGHGGGIGVAGGVKTTAGTYGSTTVTLANSAKQAMISLAIKPATAPAFVAAGALASSTGTITPALPAGIAADDILILFVESANEAISISAAGSAGTWTEVTGSPQGTGTTGATGDGTRLTVFWARYPGSGTTAPTIADSGDHTAGRIIAIRGAATSGNPINITGFGVNDVAGTTATIPGNATTVPNTYVITATAVSLPDANSAAAFSGWTNADLSSITELIDGTTSQGNGGGIGAAGGVKTTAGTYGSTTVTIASAKTAMISLAIKPINDPPTLTISQPDGVNDTVQAGTNYNITYSLNDYEDTVTAAFYYDNNNSGLDGTTISGACATAAEGTSATCSWNTTGMASGSYYVYGTTNDGVNSAVSAYSSGTITIYNVYSRTLTETLTPSDSVSKSLISSKTLTELLSTSDVISRNTSFTRSLTDTLTPSDTIAAGFLYARSLSELLTLSDTVDATTTKQITLTESLPLTDTVSTQTAFTRSLSDTLTPSDTIEGTATKQALLSDSLSLSDAVSTSASFTRSLSESLPLTDVVSSPTSFTRSLTDTLTPSDSIFAGFFFARSLSESLPLTDVISKTVSFTRSLTDTLTPSDTTIISGSFGLTLSESLSVSDVISKTASFRKTLTDTLTASDALAKDKSKTASLTDSFPISDSITLLGGQLKVLAKYNNILLAGATFLVTPNPTTGSGSLTIVDNGSNDGNSTAGVVSYQPARLVSYNITMTTVPSGYTATSLKTILSLRGSDPNQDVTFNLLSSTNLATSAASTGTTAPVLNDTQYNTITSNSGKIVTNSTSTSFSDDHDLPEIITAGRSNSTAITSATSSQNTVQLDKNISRDASGSTIISSLGIPTYTLPTSTDLAVVIPPVVTSKTSTTQIVSTPPLSAINPGQRMIIPVQKSILPSYGGITKIDIQSASNATVSGSPDKDWLTVTTDSKLVSEPSLPSDRQIQLFLDVKYRYEEDGKGINWGSTSTYASKPQITTLVPIPTDLTIQKLSNGCADIQIFTKVGSSWDSSIDHIISNEPDGNGFCKVVFESDHYSAKSITAKKTSTTSSTSTSTSTSSKGGSGRTGVGPSSSSVGGFGGIIRSPLIINEVSYDVCTDNLVKILVSSDADKAPAVTIHTTKQGTITAVLADKQPYAEQNKLTKIDTYLYEAKLTSDEKFLLIVATDTKGVIQNSVQSAVHIDSCQNDIIFEKISASSQQQVEETATNAPHIFDVRYSIANGTATRSDSTQYSYLDSQDLTISAIMQSQSAPKKAELRFVTYGENESRYASITMDIHSTTISDSIYNISATISVFLAKYPAIVYWIHVTDSDINESESTHYTMGVKPTKLENISVDLDYQTIRKSDVAAKPIVYIKNPTNIALYGLVSLKIDNKTVYSTMQMLQPGESKIETIWDTPRVESLAQYTISASIDLYGQSSDTQNGVVYVYPKTRILQLSELTELTQITDADNKDIAYPALIYASDDHADLRYRVIASDGQCIIGQSNECKITHSTLSSPNGIVSMQISDSIYRIRYTGYDSPLERFSITSIDGTIGNWNVSLESDNGLMPDAQALEDSMVKIQYRTIDVTRTTTK